MPQTEELIARIKEQGREKNQGHSQFDTLTCFSSAVCLSSSSWPPELDKLCPAAAAMQSKKVFISSVKFAFLKTGRNQPGNQKEGE